MPITLPHTHVPLVAPWPDDVKFSRAWCRGMRTAWSIRRDTLGRLALTTSYDIGKFEDGKLRTHSAVWIAKVSWALRLVVTEKAHRFVEGVDPRWPTATRWSQIPAEETEWRNEICQRVVTHLRETVGVVRL